MSIKVYKIAACGLAVFALSGCITEDKNSEGISYSAGDAIAHNSALQIVDPWPENVQDTHLVVPAENGTPSAESTTTSEPQVVGALVTGN